MRILVLSDEESKYLWDYFEKDKLDGIDLIISCGDLKPAYLSFLATFTKAPILYVHGNHDTEYDRRPPEGCICIDDDIYVFNGVRIMGLGGSIEYNKGTYQFSEKEMTKRYKKMKLKLLKHKGIDIFVSHAPAAGFNDGDDWAHKGFQVFNVILDKYKPKYFLHGHVHMSYNWKQKRVCQYNEYTTVINGYERYVFDYEEEAGNKTEIT